MRYRERIANHLATIAIQQQLYQIIYLDSVEGSFYDFHIER